ncbi:MAG: DNA glycosylase [Lachnospiraceae bacterium]|nr:DNA glycosylase [Lachnospiraceae bacterium]
MILNITEFNCKQIADSGQCFRMYEISHDHYGVPASDRFVEIIQHSPEQIEFLCTENEFETFWSAYFDLKYDYAALIESINMGTDVFLKNAVSFGYGIRILRQDPFEAMISFILSQNKNIPAIRQCVEGLCQTFGHQIATNSAGTPVYSFPTPKSLVKADMAVLRQLKAGYRDQYILNAAAAVQNGSLNLDFLLNVPAETAKKELLKIHGIGEKVANCILLFGLHQIDVYPIDVWVRRILDEIYHGNFDPAQYSGHAGIIQQYQFYYMRNGYLNKT